MKWGAFFIIFLFLLPLSIAQSKDDIKTMLEGGLKDEEEKNCRLAVFKLNFIEAYECYRDVGNLRMKQAQNALVLGNNDEAIKLGKDAVRLKAGFGLCFSRYMCGAAAHSAGIVSVAAKRKGNTGMATEYENRLIAYARNSGQCEGTVDTPEDNANERCALFYRDGTFYTLDRAKGLFQEDETCKKVRGSGDTKRADILYVGHGFANISKFKTYVSGSASTLMGYKPFNTQTDKINIWYLNERTNFDCTPLEPRMYNCNTGKVAAARKKCPNDYVVIVVDDNQWRGFGQKGGDTLGVSSWKDMPYHVILHELGHALGLNDEYEYGPGNEALADNANPNCAETSACDTFDGVAGAGCFQGCQKRAWYRSITDGMMRNLNAGSFGAFDEKLIKEKLATYK